MKKIKLTQGKWAIVDDADYEWLNQWKWQYIKPTKRCKVSYAKRTYWLKGKYKTYLMHRIIMNAPIGKEVDHIDRNGLNNQRFNLRICTGLQNKGNKSMYRNNKSGYRGVSFHKREQKWGAAIKVNGKGFHFGLFDSPELAARAYDMGAVKYRGEFAQLNFPND